MAGSGNVQRLLCTGNIRLRRPLYLRLSSFIFLEVSPFSGRIVTLPHSL